MLKRSTDLLIIRHGETDWNALQRLQGWSDIALNEAGHNQALHLNNYLPLFYFRFAMVGSFIRASVPLPLPDLISKLPPRC